MAHLYNAEAKLELDVLVVNVDQVFDRLVNDIKGVAYHFHAHLASAGNWHGIRINRLEALLEDRLLTACRRDLLLTLVTVEVLLEDGIDHKARSNRAQTTKNQLFVTPVRSILVVKNLNTSAYGCACALLAPSSCPSRL